jgi:hypothetical protein
MSCEADCNFTLAELSSLGNVTVCACGTIHLSVGVVTLRMAPEVFGQMVQMCQQAAEQLLLKAFTAVPVSRLAN